jgi:hypothetical protein
MTPYKTATREIPHEALTEQEILEGNVGTLLHELSHQMNASDHYCLVYDTVAEMREVDTPCDNDRCPICNYQVDNEADAKNRRVEMPDGYWSCAMIDSANNTHCEACKEDIIEYIKQNLEQSVV